MIRKFFFAAIVLAICSIPAKACGPVAVVRSNVIIANQVFDPFAPVVVQRQFAVFNAPVVVQRRAVVKNVRRVGPFRNVQKTILR